MFDIAIAFDRNLLHVAHVVVRSALAHASVPLRVHALTRGIEHRDFAPFRERCEFQGKRAEIHQVEMAADWGDVKIGAALTVSTMDRIFLPAILNDVDRCLYLDIDTVVLDDVDKLNAIAPGPKGIAAKASTRPAFKTMAHFARRAQIDWQALVDNVGSNPRNFNAGVLWMSLDTLRQSGMTSRCRDLVTATRCNDQLALVGYCEDDFAELPARWNAWASVDAHMPHAQPYGVLHYVGSRKPWNGSKVLRKHWDLYV